MADNEHVVWNVDLEVSLFHSMRRNKPVGVNRHFQMALIHDRLNKPISQKITAKEIWKHLGEMYDLQALNESEIIPFPNKELEFSLPYYDYVIHFKDEFPRTPEATIVPDDAGSDAPKQTGGKTRSTKVVPSPAVATVAATTTMDDSPKREQRKRTRGQVSSDSPATKETTPQASKRARRT